MDFACNIYNANIVRNQFSITLRNILEMKKVRRICRHSFGIDNRATLLSGFSGVRNNRALNNKEFWPFVTERAPPRRIPRFFVASLHYHEQVR